MTALPFGIETRTREELFKTELESISVSDIIQ
jgi:hypothetical protein